MNFTISATTPTTNCSISGTSTFPGSNVKTSDKKQQSGDVYRALNNSELRKYQNAAHKILREAIGNDNY